MSIDLYFNRISAPSRAVLATAKQLNISVNVINLDWTKGEHLTPQYTKLNPFHSVPTINDNGFVLWEGPAIQQYLVNQYAPNSGLYPNSPKLRAIVDRWLNFVNTVNQQIREFVLIKHVKGVDLSPEQQKSFTDNVNLLNQLIGDNQYLVSNELTIADIAVLATVSSLRTLRSSAESSDVSKIKAYVTRLRAELPYYQEVIHLTDEEVEESLSKFRANKK